MPTEAEKRCPKPRTTMVPGSGPAAHAGVLHAHHRKAAKGAEYGATHCRRWEPRPYGPQHAAHHRPTRCISHSLTASTTKVPNSRRDEARTPRLQPPGPAPQPAEAHLGLRQAHRPQPDCRGVSVARKPSTVAGVEGRSSPGDRDPTPPPCRRNPHRRHRRGPPPTSARRKCPAATITGHRLELLSGVASGGGEDGGEGGVWSWRRGRPRVA